MHISSLKDVITKIYGNYTCKKDRIRDIRSKNQVHQNTIYLIVLFKYRAVHISGA